LKASFQMVLSDWISDALPGAGHQALKKMALESELSDAICF